MRKVWFWSVGWLLSVVGFASPPSPSPGWGIDACLLAHVGKSDQSEYFALLRQSQVNWLRERLPESGHALVRASGYQVAAFVHLEGLAVHQPGNQLPEDLLAVYEAARRMQETHGRYVDAWEMVGEPDLGYCRDLPDRVAAYQKAVYLGIKRGAMDSSSPPLALSDQAGEVTPSAIPSEDVSLSRLVGAERGESPIIERRLPPTEKQAPLVLMGALGNTPGPWLERAARNGLLDYTDAYNFHFYGRPEDFTQAINAHAAFANRWVESSAQDSSGRVFPSKWRPDFRPKSTVHGLSWVTDPAVSRRRTSSVQYPTSNVQRPASNFRITSSGSHPKPYRSLPLWATEVGENAVDPDDFFNSDRRQWQADFTLSTARQARAHPALAMFMPFVLAWEGKPWAMTTAGAKPLPAWTAYARFTQENPWPRRNLSRPPFAPNPVVLQWLPDNRTTTTHKVAGTYRFKANEPIVGQIWIYNFSDVPVVGVMRGMATKSVHVQPLGHWSDPTAWTNGRRVTIPAMGKVAFPVMVSAKSSGYFREYLSAEFMGDNGQPSAIYFGVERRPQGDDFVTERWEIQPLREGEPRHPMFTDYTITSRSGPWTGLNGLKIDETSTTDGTLGLKVWTEEVQNDPLRPTMAVARLRGLPREGFIHVKTVGPAGAAGRVRVDLLDRAGQRFTIWENLGRDYSGPQDEAWLNLADFHSYSWGRVTTDPTFHPERVEEIQLRFFDLTDPVVSFRAEFTLNRRAASK